MRALFRGLMVPVFFLVFLGFYGATALAVIALGPVLIEGLPPEQLQTLIPTGGGTPSPWVVAAGAALVADLFIGMIAMLISEKVLTVGRFTRSLTKTAFWFAVIFAGGLAVWLNGQPGDPWPKFAPALLLAAGLIAGAIVCGILLGKPFLWWVSERPPAPKPRRTAPAPTVTVEPLPAAAAAPVPPPVAATAAPVQPAGRMDEPSPAI
jgi:hypothetical protein